MTTELPIGQRIAMRFPYFLEDEGMRKSSTVPFSSHDHVCS